MYTSIFRRGSVAALFSIVFFGFSLCYAQTIDTQPPSTPANLIGTPTTNSVYLSWSASTDNVGVTSYSIFKNGTLVHQNLSGTSTAGTAYLDSGLVSNTTYTYSVTASDAAGNISSSTATIVTTKTVSTGDTQSPTTPSGLTASATYSSPGGGQGYDGVNLSWSVSTDNVGVVGYKITRDKTSLGTYQIGTTASKTYWDNGAYGLTTYSYTVVAYDQAGNNSSPATVTITTPLGNGAIVKTISKATLYWNMTSPLKATGSQTAGVTGTVMSGPYVIVPNKITKTSQPVTYYLVNFPPLSSSGPGTSSGPDGWVDQAAIQGTLATTEYTSPKLVIADMQAVLEKLEAQLRSILSKIEDLKGALLAAAAATQ